MHNTLGHAFKQGSIFPLAGPQRLLGQSLRRDVHQGKTAFPFAPGDCGLNMYKAPFASSSLQFNHYSIWGLVLEHLIHKRCNCSPGGSTDEASEVLINQPRAVRSQHPRSSQVNLPDEATGVEYEIANGGKIVQVRVLSETPTQTMMFPIDSTMAPVDNLCIRQALNYALDKETIIDNISGLGEVSRGILSPMV